jgi:hypothetical protein
MSVLPPSVSKDYFEIQPQLELLQRDLDRFLAARPRKWHVVTRVKTVESAAQKLQTGRASGLSSMEDLVGAMIVVPTVSDIAQAESFVGEFFVENYRRPVVGLTAKVSSSFEFDDLRLYGTLRLDDTLPKVPYQRLTFEIQIKTFLQHAWAVATHDLIYKHDRVSWARSRVAFQVKALLEHAELSIGSIDALESSPVVDRTGRTEGALQELIQYFSANWESDFLPQDLRRLAESVTELGRRLGVESVQDLIEMFKEAKEHYAGYPFGWDPYVVMVDYLSTERPTRLKNLLKRSRTPPKGKPYFVVVTEDVLRRLSLTIDEAPCAIV